MIKQLGFDYKSKTPQIIDIDDKFINDYFLLLSTQNLKEEVKKMKDGQDVHFFPTKYEGLEIMALIFTKDKKDWKRIRYQLKMDPQKFDKSNYLKIQSDFEKFSQGELTKNNIHILANLKE